MRVHCIQHSDRVRGQGVIDWARARGHDLEIVLIAKGDPLPEPDEIEALIVLGGQMNTDDVAQHPWLDLEREWLGRVVRHTLASDDGPPVLGICLGSQLLAEVLGGSCGRAPAPEIGWHRIALTEQGRRLGALRDLPDSFDVMQWHGDAWTLPPGAELVATGAPGSGICATQAFHVDEKIWGVQFHPEFRYARMVELAATTTDDLSVGGLVQTAEEFLASEDRFEQLRHEVHDPLLDGIFGGVVDRQGLPVTV